MIKHKRMREKILQEMRRKNIAMQGAVIEFEQSVPRCTSAKTKEPATQQCGILTSMKGHGNGAKV
ncbi:hypothetical protein FRZ06_03925 [Anoxybacterium hadale]|uniref:Uncharacterized protein n=1 Tax=Anoxybacterium hadale TaxID=3408580 RepID=A0ACD1A866_9FIRM|nr:hypothetical protein FRZ06_03925 [Clostridiales bacterium]